MAAEHYDKARAGELLTDFAQRAMTEAIRSVCEYLRSGSPGISAQRSADDHKTAAAIERHFLEPR